MCFVKYSNRKLDPKKEVKTAKKNITVWKYVLPMDDNKFSPPYYGRIGTFYKPGKVSRKVKLGVSNRPSPDTLIVGRGYHSCKTRKQAYLDHGEQVYKFIIPKGAKYLSNSTEYVSDIIKMAPLTKKK